MMEVNSEIDAHITNRYQIKRRIGKGAYGIVWRAFDKKTKNEIALKKIFDAFQNRTDAQRTYREIFYLRKFMQHPNIVKLLNTHPANNSKDIYLVFEHMEIDLHKVIRKGTILKDIHKRYIIYQILKAVAYIHSANVIHRDLKPANILLNSQCICKIADFGLARSVTQCVSAKDERYDPSLTDYIATRWYRAPEILVASKKYEKGVDMWSVGCILAEMYLGRPLFPGTSTINQIELILSSVPPASNADIRAVSSGYGKSLLLENLSMVKKYSVNKLLKDVNEEGFDLIKKFLMFNPRKRITAAQAIKHAYVSLFSDDQDIQLCNCCCTVRPLLRDDVQLSVEEYRRKLYDVIERNNGNDSNHSQRTYSYESGIIDIKELYNIKKLYNPSKDKRILAEITDKRKGYCYDESYRTNLDHRFKENPLINCPLKSNNKLSSIIKSSIRS